MDHLISFSAFRARCWHACFGQGCLQARARCCSAQVGKLVVDKAFPVDFLAERGQDGLRGR